jgi:hypothetical protein
MTFNRTKAKRIKGEHCHFCGDSKVPLVKTRCCDQWICCDTKSLSFRGGGFCQDPHERYSICHSHYIDGHKGDFKNCAACLAFWSKRDFENNINYSKFPEARDSIEAEFYRAHY